MMVLFCVLFDNVKHLRDCFCLFCRENTFLYFQFIFVSHNLYILFVFVLMEKRKSSFSSETILFSCSFCSHGLRHRVKYIPVIKYKKNTLRVIVYIFVSIFMVLQENTDNS